MFMSENSRGGAGSNTALLHGTTSTDRTRIAVVIPALNEESSIGLVVQAIPRPLVAEIIVVDNGSTDRTETVARDSGAMVLFESRKGYGYACLAGIHHAVNNGAEIIVFLDGDFSDYPEELPKLVWPIIEQGYDMVIGSRMIGAREKGAMLPQALFGNWLACTLIRLFWDYRFTDLGPFRAIRVDALQKMEMSDKTFGWTVEMQIKAAKLKLKSTEVPVSYRKRIGTSKVTGTVRGTVNASVKILYTIFKYLLVAV
jgi:glycosyltransferase involved in cell wall biosynthesis